MEIISFLDCTRSIFMLPVLFIARSISSFQISSTDTVSFHVIIVVFKCRQQFKDDNEEKEKNKKIVIGRFVMTSRSEKTAAGNFVSVRIRRQSNQVEYERDEPKIYHRYKRRSHINIYLFYADGMNRMRPNMSRFRPSLSFVTI